MPAHVHSVPAPDPPPAATAPAPANTRLTLAGGLYTITFDHLEGTFAGQLTASGHVTVLHQDIRISADQAVVNLTTQDVEATGHVQVTNPEGTFTAAMLRYNAKTGAAEGTELETRYDDFSVRAASFRLVPAPRAGQPPTLTALQGAITSCTFDHPDYLLSAQSIQLTPRRSLTVRGSTLWLFGLRLIRLPRLSFNLAPSTGGQRRESLLPPIGYSQATGVFATFSLATRLGAGTSGHTTLTLSSKLFLSGGLDLNQVAGQPIGVAVTAREQEPRYGYPTLLLDRLPEIHRTYSKHSPSGTGYLSLVSDIGAGHYIQHHPLQVGNRVFGRAALVWAAPGTSTFPILGVGISDAVEGGNHYTLLGADIGYRSVLSPIAAGRLEFLIDGVRGRTPFAFDRLESPTRVRLALDSEDPRLGGTIGITYDLSHRHLNDLSFTLAHTLKCIRPSIGYHFQNRQILIGLSIPALEGVSSLFHRGRRPGPPSYTWQEGEALPTGGQ